MACLKPSTEPQLWLNGLGYSQWRVPAAITGPVQIVDAGVRILGWADVGDGRQLQCSVMLDRGNVFKNTTGWRTSTQPPWLVTFEPGNPIVHEGDSSQMEPLVILDIIQYRQTSEARNIYPKPFNPATDSIYLEFGGDGDRAYSTPLQMVWWVCWV